MVKNRKSLRQREVMDLRTAVEKSCLDTVRSLLQKDVGDEITMGDPRGNTPLHLAFNNKSYDIMDLLLSDPNIANSNSTNNEGLSHFHIACTRNNVKVVKSFIESGVCFDTCVPEQSNPIWSGYSPLHFAVSYNSSKIAKLLLDSGANAQIKDSKGFTPLHLAFHYSYEMFGEDIENILTNSSKHKQIIQQLVPHEYIDIAKFDGSDIKEDYNINRIREFVKKIYWLPNRKEYLKIVNLLLNCKVADLNCRDNCGRTPLYYACLATIRNKQYIFKKILDSSVWLRFLTIESLYEELYERKKIILRYFMELDVNLDKSYINSSFYYLCCNYHVRSYELMYKEKLITMLLDFGANVNCTDPRDGSTPILIASCKTHSSFDSVRTIFEMLVDQGANVNARQSNGRTALHILASCRFVDSCLPSKISILMRAGADINSQDSQGLTPLHLACENMLFETQQILLEHGADVNVEDNKGKSVCCYLNDERYQKNRYATYLWPLAKHIIKMNVIGIPVNEKIMSWKSKFNPPEQMNWIEQCEKEMQVFKDTQIHDRCTLYDLLFKNENALSQLVNNPIFENIAKSESLEVNYPMYSYLINIKYQEGVVRGKLLPIAKTALNKLAEMHLPDMCSENICKYFTNRELEESTKNLRDVVILNADKKGEKQLTKPRENKRQKVK